DVRLGQACDLGNEFKITDHLPVDKCSRIILSPYVSTGGANGEQARFKAHIARRREQTEIGTKPAAGQAYDFNLAGLAGRLRFCWLGRVFVKGLFFGTGGE